MGITMRVAITLCAPMLAAAPAIAILANWL
jgi:hypothetical protein